MDYQEEYSKKFLIKYAELEFLQENEPDKYHYLVSHFPAEFDLFRYTRNTLAHNSIDGHYPFAVSESCLNLITNLLKSVKTKAYSLAKKRKKIRCVSQENTLNDAIRLMSRYHYSYLPVLNKKDCVEGIISSDDIIDFVSCDKIKLFEEPISRHIEAFNVREDESTFYISISQDMDLYQLKNLLTGYNKKERKLGIVFVTKNGKMNEPLLGLLTPWDILKHFDW